MLDNEDSSSGPYSGDGVNKTFTYDYRVDDADHLEVILVQPQADGSKLYPVLRVGVDYSVTGVGNPSGGSIEFPIPGSTYSVLPAGSFLFILRDPPFTQGVDLSTLGQYRPNTIEYMVDEVVKQTQRLLLCCERAYLAPVGEKPSKPVDELIKALELRVILRDGSHDMDAGYIPSRAGDVITKEYLSAHLPHPGPHDANTVDTIAALKALDTTVFNVRVYVRGYYEVGDTGGGTFDWDPLSTEADDLGLVIAPNGATGAGRWKRDYSGPIHIKWFGAKGDNVSNDTSPISNWLASGNHLIGADGDYRLTRYLGDKTISKSFTLDGNGMKLVVDNTISHGALGPLVNIYVANAANIELVKIIGLHIDAKEEYLGGIRVQGRPDSHVSLLSIKNNTVLNLNNINYKASVIGIAVRVSSSMIEVKHNFIYNLTRTQVNPGNIASVGIHISESIGSIRIEDNAINRINSPAGDADADGIQVFAPDWHLAKARNRQDVEIKGNRIVECKGRFIKLQTTKTRVYGNYMANFGTVDTLNDFRGIDCQVGGSSIFDNVMIPGGSASGLSRACLGLKVSEFAWEEGYDVHDNVVYLEQSLGYFAILQHGDTSKGEFKIHDNIIMGVTTGLMMYSFAYIVATEGFTKSHLSITNNSAPIGDGAFLRITPPSITEDATKGPIFANKFSFRLVNNENTKPTANSDVIDSLSGKPYLYNFVSRNNVGIPPNRGVNFKGCDIHKLPSGINVMFGTDGGAGGLINVPASYARYVQLETHATFTKITKSNGDFLISSKDGVRQVEFKGTVI